MIFLIVVANGYVLVTLYRPKTMTFVSLDGSVAYIW